jgi:SnoaL-like domain
MTEHSSAIEVALAYHRAWTGHDFEKAMTYISPEIVCDAPAGRLEGADAFRSFMGPFVSILTTSSLVAAFGDEQTALLMYDTQTVPVKSAPGAEWVSVRGGQIVRMRIIFDRAPFNEARARKERLTLRPLRQMLFGLSSSGRRARHLLRRCRGRRTNILAG